jgi:hypothetical protein
MISKQEYLSKVRDLLANDSKNKVHAPYLKNGYAGKGTFFLTTGILAVVAAFMSLFMAEEGGLSAILIIYALFAIPVGSMAVYNSGRANKYYEENYKAKAIAILLEEGKYSYNRTGYIDRNIFKESQIAGYFERYTGEDLLSINIPNDDGSLSQTYFTMCDVKATKTERDSDGDTRTVTVYDGIFGYITFPKTFKCLLCINSSYRKPGSKFEKVVLEDINFHKEFTIRCSDQIEARYILTPTMMEKLLSLRKSAGRVKITMVDDKLYVGFTSQDLFRLSGLKEGEAIENIFEEIYDQISFILDFIKEIQTNNKIFKM